MSTTGTALTISRPESTAIARAAASPVDFPGLYQMAEALVPTGFLPDHIRNAGQACAIILAGQELGMQPMRALRSLQMVKGKVVESADSQLARFKSDGGRAQFVELSETRAELKLRHPNGDEHTESFTIEDAKRAGLAGPGSMYAKYPKAMIRSRVITAGLKSLGWEGGAGVYDPEEAAAFSAAPAPSQSATARRAEPEHDIGDAPDAEEMTLEQASAFPFPFQRGKPPHGKPMGSLDSAMLQQVASWITDKRAERGEPTWHADTMEAIALILDDREKDQTTLPLETSADAASAAPAPRAERLDVPKGGRVADALEPNARADHGTATSPNADDADVPF
jgi:hypothetical protein